MEPERMKKQIVCDAVAAEEAMGERYYRHESLTGEIGQGIRGRDRRPQQGGARARVSAGDTAGGSGRHYLGDHARA
ncbi:MAG: hypothetical protein WAO08_30825 [Hyphomicrobiaceae bacterium]